MKKLTHQGRERDVLTRENDGLHSELVAPLLNAAVECWDVLLLSKYVGFWKYSLYLSHMAHLKLPIKGDKEKRQTLTSAD